MFISKLINAVKNFIDDPCDTFITATLGISLDFIRTIKKDSQQAIRIAQDEGDAELLCTVYTLWGNYDICIFFATLGFLASTITLLCYNINNVPILICLAIWVFFGVKVFLTLLDTGWVHGISILAVFAIVITAAVTFIGLLTPITNHLAYLSFSTPVAYQPIEAFSWLDRSIEFTLGDATIGFHIFSTIIVFFAILTVCGYLNLRGYCNSHMMSMHGAIQRAIYQADHADITTNTSANNLTTVNAIDTSATADSQSEPVVDAPEFSLASAFKESEPTADVPEFRLANAFKEVPNSSILTRAFKNTSDESILAKAFKETPNGTFLPDAFK